MILKRLYLDYVGDPVSRHKCDLTAGNPKNFNARHTISLNYFNLHAL